jgi:hypothetical protein
VLKKTSREEGHHQSRSTTHATNATAKTPKAKEKEGCA